MTREQYEKMSFEELIDWASENLDDFRIAESLKDFAIAMVNEDSFLIASHVLDALHENSTEYYMYDFSMGTLETPRPITSKSDIEYYIDFDEDSMFD